MHELRDLPLEVREEIGNVLGCEAAAHGLDQGEEPNAYGVELGELFGRRRGLRVIRGGAA